MRKKMQVVSVLAFGLYGMAAAQSGEPANKAPRAPSTLKQIPGAESAALPPSLSGSLTQQLTRAALAIHDQAPLWPAEPTSGSPSPSAKGAAKLPVPKAAASVSGAAASAALLPADSSLPQLPSAALIGQVVSGAAQPKQVRANPVQALAAPATVVPVKITPAKTAAVKVAPAKMPASAQPVQAQLKRQLGASAAVSRVAAAAARTALQVTPPVAAPRVPAAQPRTVQASKPQVKPQVAASRPQPARMQPVAVAPATSPVVSRPQQRGYGYSRTVKATAYSSDVGQTDNSPFITATGTRVRPGVIALSRDLLRIFPYGSRVTLQDSAGLLNGRTFIVEDTMNVRMANTVDIWMGSRAQAYQWGSRSVTITALH